MLSRDALVNEIEYWKRVWADDEYVSAMAVTDFLDWLLDNLE